MSQTLSAVYIYDAVRTPRGKAKASGALAQLSPQELLAQLYQRLSSGLPTGSIDGLIVGCVGQLNSQGGNIALVTKLHSGISESASAFTLNNYCASGLTAINTAAAKIANGEWQSALAGGVEMMSQVPFLGDGAAYYADKSLPKRARFIPVALAADRLAEKAGITRADLDAISLRSQQRASKAELNTALIKSRISVRGSDGAVLLDTEECLRPQSSPEAFAALEPAFAELASHYQDELGTPLPLPQHTIAHAPPVCDGAGLAYLSVYEPHAASSSAPKPRAKVIATSDVGGDVEDSLLAGFSAMQNVLDRANVSLQDIGRIEFMEAFGVTIAKFLRDHSVDPERVNVAGGHIAKGHPLGATGAILLSSLLDALDESEEDYGLVVVTGASGAGSAMLVQRCT